jgi:putative molybdopterin biosynthesis protein
MAVAWLATRFSEIVSGFSLQLSFSGSLGGLIALAEGQADLAGCHLWDQESDSYNLPFVRRLLPGRRVALLTLAHRHLGLIVASGNPVQIGGLEDLARPGLRFVNRQPGSGTRVWLDASLHQLGIQASQINGYLDEKLTHSEVARSVADGRADVGLGLEASARVFELWFLPLVVERYDFVLLAETMETLWAKALGEWLRDDEARNAIEALGGYDVDETGLVRWIE